MYKVILVDDDYMVLDGMRYYLDWAAMGLEIVAVAEDGLEAMRKVRELRPHIVISDVVMPGISGTKLAQMIKEENPNTQIIMVSAHQDFNFVKSALKVGTVDYLLKPFEQQEFHDAVEKAVNRLEKVYEVERLATDYSKYLEESIAPPEDDRLDKLQEKLVNLCGTGHTDEVNDTLQQFSDALKEEKKGSMIYLLSITLNLLSSILRRKASSLDSEEAKKFLQSLNSVKNFSSAEQVEAFFIERFRFIDRLTGGDQANRPRKVVRDIQDIIRQRYFEPLTIGMIAQEVYMSAGYIQTLFKKETGMTINDYITRIRIESGKELLKDSSIRIYDVANLVGYQDTNYFTKIFKKYVGMNPLDYRESLL